MGSSSSTALFSSFFQGAGKSSHSVGVHLAKVLRYGAGADESVIGKELLDDLLQVLVPIHTLIIIYPLKATTNSRVFATRDGEAFLMRNNSAG